MRNIKLTIEYDGTDFIGWQIQKEGRTVQGIIRDVIWQITGEKVKLIGAGRTDSGVHATGQVANFHTESGLSTEELHKALNALLPDDVAVAAVEEVDEDFNARYTALSRRYRYLILNRGYPSPIMRRYVWYVPRELDANLMNRALKVLEGTHDFSSFQRRGNSRKNPVCTVMEALCRREGDMIRIEVEADSFLRGMVRAIVGTLLKVIEHAEPEEKMTEILAAKDRSAAGPSAPPHGLCLIKVRYPGRDEV